MATNSSSSETTVVVGGGAGGAGGGGRKEIMLFGVRVVVDPMRKSVSLNNLSEYEQPEEILKQISGGGGDGVGEEKNKADTAAAGYASADDAVPMSSSGGNRERKRGIPWTEEEHKLFLLGLQKVGKGDWKGISRNFVKTRTPTQVASHAQKYFIRRSNLNRRRRRSSLFDMTTDTFTGMAMGEDQVHAQENTSSSSPLPLVPENNGSSGHPAVQVFPTVGPSMQNGNLLENSTLGQPPCPKNSSSNLGHLFPVTFQAPPGFGLNIYENSTVDPSSLSLSLSLASPYPRESSSSNHPAFKAMPNSFNNGDSNSIVGVA